MSEVRLTPFNPERPAPLPPGDSAIGALFNSVTNCRIQSDLNQDIQLIRYLNLNVILLNSPRIQAPFRQYYKTSPHDPETVKILGEALKNDPYVFLRSKCACLTEMPYWFTYDDLEKDIKKIISCLYLKGLIGSKLRLDIEPFETAAKTLAIDFKNGLVFSGDQAIKNKAFLLMLPFYVKIASTAKRLFELLAENPSLQEHLKAELKKLNVLSFEQLKEEHVYLLPDLNELINQALKDNEALYFSREMTEDYELIDGEKRYKIPKGAKVIFPCRVEQDPPCPGFKSGMLALRVLFIFLLMKGSILKEIKNVQGAFYLPATKINYRFKQN